MSAFLKKPAVQLTLFAAAVLTAGAFFYLQGDGATQAPPPKPPPAGMGQAAAEKIVVGRRDLKGSETIETNKLDKLVLPPLKPEPPTIIKSEPQAAPKEEAPRPPVFPDLVQVRVNERMQPFKAQAPEVFAPRGTLIKAALVITLESNAIGTPVLAMVTEDVFFQGNLIVPAGTQIVAEASVVETNSEQGGGNNSPTNKFRDRINLRGAFNFIWADGSEYVINAVALNHEPLPDGTMALTDGSPGIRGRIIKTDDYAELKVLVSEALQGIMVNQQSTFQSIYGLFPTNNNRNAALGGGASGASAYSDLLVRKLEQDLEYVQVPAGSSFYVYTLDVFEPELRSIGGLKQGNIAKSGIDLQRDAYTQLALEAVQSANDIKARVDQEQQATAAARERDLMERASSLISEGATPAEAPPPPDAAATLGSDFFAPASP
jgi:hypothetical protein